jgi:hypothetical protein
VAKQFMADAIRLWRQFLWPHARAAMRQIGLTDRHKNARRVLKWLKAHPDVTEISVKDIRRDALAQSLDAKDTEDLLNGLVAAGWLKPKPIPKAEGPGRPAHRWGDQSIAVCGCRNCRKCRNSLAPNLFCTSCNSCNLIGGKYEAPKATALVAPSRRMVRCVSRQAL